MDKTRRFVFNYRIFASLLSARTVSGLKGETLHLKASTLGINELSIIATIIILIVLHTILVLRKGDPTYITSQEEVGFKGSIKLKYCEYL